MPYYLYILASKPNGILYVGSTSDLVRRVYQHREKLLRGFTFKYNVTRLVHFEMSEYYAAVAQREKRIKKWPRAWKIALIESQNPQWRDLYDEIAA